MSLQRLRTWIFLSMVFLIPLVFNPWGVDIYEIPKNTVFKVGVGGLGILWVIEALREKRLRFFFSQKTALCLLFFVLVLVLSWLVSVRPSVSFWGTYYKQGGIVNMLYYLLFFILATDFFSLKGNRLSFLRALTWSGALVSSYALVQKLGVDFLPDSIADFFEGRSFSSLGNPSALASFLLFPLGAELMLLREQHTRWRKGATGIRIGLLLLALLASRGRASILGLILAATLLLCKRFKGSPKKLVAFAGVGLVALGLFIGAYGSDLRSLRSRFTLWESSVHMIEEQPVLGYGLENFGFIFPSYTTAEFYQHEDYYSVADRPHNEFLELWIHLGILGALAYTALVFFVLHKFWTTREREVSFVSATVLALFTSNFFGFSLITHFVFLTLFLALLVHAPARVYALAKGRALLCGGLGILFFLSLNFPVRIFLSDLAFKGADTAFLEGETETAHLGVGWGQRLNPFFAEPYTLSFKIDFALALQTQEIRFLEAAEDDLQKAYDKDRGTLKTMINLMQFYSAQGRSEEAEAVLEVLEQRGGVQALLFQVAGEFYYQAGRYEEAILHYEKLLAVLPAQWQAPVLTGGELTEASRIFWKNHPDFITVLQHLADAYLRVGKAEKGEALLMKLT